MCVTRSNTFFFFFFKKKAHFITPNARTLLLVKDIKDLHDQWRTAATAMAATTMAATTMGATTIDRKEDDEPDSSRTLIDKRQQDPFLVDAGVVSLSTCHVPEWTEPRGRDEPEPC